jgi:hypothetical protein
MLDCRRDPETIMRNSPLMIFTFLGLALGLTVSACDGGDDESADTMVDGETAGDGDGDSGDGDPGDGDGDTGDGDGDPTGSECYPQPAECAQFVRCIGALVPSQLEGVESEYGADGACWCGTEAKAQGCYATCLSEIEKALVSNPTEAQCHESVCGIEELDPDQPYGPIANGTCTPYISEQGEPIEQVPFMSPLGLPGGFCAPQCSGLANYCPESSQTSAQGTCYLVSGPDSYCVSRCYIDSEIVGGTQCQCGATCQPQGAPDGEGNMRGLCTFE